MIAWGYWLTYGGRRRGFQKRKESDKILRVFPGQSKAKVKEFARDASLCTEHSVRVVKLRVEEIPTCGCALVDDLPVVYRRHSEKMKRKAAR